MVIRVMLDTDTISSLHLSERDKMVLMNVTQKLHKERTREAAPPPPEGGISISEACREYDLNLSTLSRWVKDGLIPVVERRSKWIYLKKSAVAEFAAKYHQSPGRGKRAHLKAPAS